MALRRRQRSGGTGPAPERPPESPVPNLVDMLARGDVTTFARCFESAGTVRVPHPGGDRVYQGRAQIEQAAREALDATEDLVWEPSHRFISATEVTEEGVLTATPRAGHDPAGRPERLAMPIRAVAGFRSGAEVLSSLTVWVDWSALGTSAAADPAGTARALIAHARAREGRALSVIAGEPGEVAGADGPAALTDQRRASQPVPFWQRHRRAAGIALLACLTTAALAWLGVNIIQLPLQSRAPAAGSAAPGPSPPSTSRPSSASTGSSAPDPEASGAGRAKVPVIAPPKPDTKPTVQAGPQVVLSADVLFETGSAQLTPVARSRLARVVRRIQGQAVQGVVQVNGYTDNVGSPKANIVLSRARALAVARVLQAGLSGSAVRLAPQGFGEADPIATNQTAGGRQHNRRVAVVLPLSR